jgi:hypothetical protein
MENDNLKNEQQCAIHDVKQRCIDFAEWCMKNKYTYYFNGEKWMWANAKKQEYYTTHELYEKCFNNVA